MGAGSFEKCLENNLFPNPQFLQRHLLLLSVMRKLQNLVDMVQPDMCQKLRPRKRQCLLSGPTVFLYHVFKDLVRDTFGVVVVVVVIIVVVVFFFSSCLCLRANNLYRSEKLIISSY